MLQTSSCRRCSKKFGITDDDLAFYHAISPVISGKTYEIPQPSLCPDCRMQRRLSFRNERTLYFRPCGRCKKQSVSIYAPEAPFTVYCSACFWSDENDATKFGRDVDFSRGFFEQFHDLWKQTPLLSVWTLQCENSEFNNNCFALKDSYMNFNTDRGRNNYYNYIGEYCDDIADCSYIRNSELCYECVDCRGSYHCFFSQELENCQDCYFSSDLVGCQNCFGCHGLRHKEYYIFNKKVTREEWNEKMKLLLLTPQSIQDFQEESEKIALQIPHRYSRQISCESCTGDHLFSCKNAQNCFDVINGEDVKNVAYGAFPIHHVQDAFALGEVEWTYEFLGGGAGISHVAFINNAAFGLADSYYIVQCLNGSKNLFGCVGLKKKQYCILNKQYSKNEYEALVPRIIEHMTKGLQWGEYFPSEISPFGYNETLAQQWYPLSKEEALAKGYSWKEKDKREYVQTHVEVPENIRNVEDAICKEILSCETCGKNYKIVLQELEFYRKLAIPIPRACPDCRYARRMARRNPPKLFDRACAQCTAAIKTTCPLERKERVLCEKCYLDAVI